MYRGWRMRRRDGQPQWIDEAGGRTESLNRADLGGKSETGRYSEAWLQNLLHARPEIFPIEQIEPGFGDLIPLCREFPVAFGAGRSGALDNLYATASGGLVLVEAKLWRNPEARRSVVAQAMEYAAAIFRMSYEELEQAVLRARTSEDKPATSMFDIVSGDAGGDEAEFVDAVSRNLRRGRAIIAVVGDGIREDIAPLAELLQSHAGHRFTFALVELAVYETPATGVRVVVPSVLAQTELIERGVVRIEGDVAGLRVEIEQPRTAGPLGTSVTKPRALSLGEDEYFELLGQTDPAWPPMVKSLLSRLEPFGLYAEVKRGLNLKHAAPIGEPFNLGTIGKDGWVDTGPATWRGRKDEGHRYNEALAIAISGVVRETKGGEESALRTSTGRMPRISDLLPAHEDAWIDAIEAYLNAFNGEDL